MTVGHRLFTAEGNGFDALGGDAEELQALLDGFGTLLTEGECVLAAAAFVGVALDDDVDVRMSGKPAGRGASTAGMYWASTS